LRTFIQTTADALEELVGMVRSDIVCPASAVADISVIDLSKGMGANADTVSVPT
jgi:hypothetical protein